MIYEIWKNKIKEWQDKYPICSPEYKQQKDYVNPYCFMKVLSEHTDKDAIIIPDSGGTLIWFYQGIKFKEGQTVFSAFNHSPMGYSLPAAIGAYYADQKRQVIAVMGDGSFCMNTQELETLAYNKIPIKMFVMANKEYGIINDTQKTWLDHVTASDPESGLGFPDIKKVAEAYGINTLEINSHESLDMLVQYVLGCTVPTLAVIKVKPGTGFNPKLKSGQPLENLSPFLPEEEIKENLI